MAPTRPPGRAPAWLLVLHRYLGMVLGLLMLVWCLSGAVMVFVQYPSLDEAARLRGLAPIDWRGWRDPIGVGAQDKVQAAAVESLAGRPVLRVSLADGKPQTIDLASGAAPPRISSTTARAAAADFARPLGAKVGPGPAVAIERDQWTVSGEFNRDRPLFRFDLGDPAATQVYISSASGRAVQATTGSQRFWNWLGATPHWLYFTALRRTTAVWSQVVIWTSLLGCFLTLTGLYVGWAAFRPHGDHRWSRFGGIWLWHHLTGLVFGVLTLTWVASGLVSMNPWGFLEGSDDEAPARLRGPPPAWSDVWPAFQRVAAHPPPGLVSLGMAPLDGRIYFIGRTADGGKLRLGASGSPAPLGKNELTAAATRLAGGAPTSEGLVTREDAYVFSHHERAPLPAYRVAVGKRTYYLDLASGALVARFDPDARGYRWLHEALHRWDFIPGVRRGPLWSTMIILLLAGVTAGVATGAWLSIKAVIRDFRLGLHRLRRRRPLTT